MFVPVFGKQVDASVFKGTTLVLPSQSIGLSPFIGMDLFILNSDMERVGFYKSEYIAAALVNDIVQLADEESGKITMPAEFYVSKEHNLTFLMVRSGPVGGMRKFCDELVAFIEQVEFTNVAIITSTMSPVARERESSRQIPEVFAYCNNFLYKSNT